mmetsp:Transcript_12742/g.19378  ORF Transcript_12742/g.19378 Transcript_12742/m.19378 type:complete len:87 (-) Transcript_12742:156-416(-)
MVTQTIQEYPETTATNIACITSAGSSTTTTPAKGGRSGTTTTRTTPAKVRSSTTTITTTPAKTTPAKGRKLDLLPLPAKKRRRRKS